MVSPSQLASWQPAKLSEIAEQVLAHRRALTGLHDDLDAGAPPASWTFTDATRARAEHHRLSGLLATQVSESVGVVDALDTAVTAITAAKHLLEGAMRRAGAQGLNVDHGTGRVTVVRKFDDEDDLAHARTVMHEVSEQIDTALRDAAAADQALAAVLTRAATTDVNDVGTLAQQQALLDFQKLGAADQVRYLLDHPEAYTLLGDHVSDAVKERVGAQIADDLDRLARHPEDFADAEAVARYGRLLDAFGDDPGVMAPMYNRIGPDGLLGTLNGIGSMLYVSSNDQGLAHLAESLRDGLATASRAEGFDAKGYGEELVRYATVTAGNDQQDAYFRDYPSTAMGASVLDFLLRDGDYGEEFVRGVVWELDEFERTAGTLGVQTWMHHTGDGWPLNGIGVDPGQVMGRWPDPMAAAMGQLGQHPGLGLEFFTEDEGRYEQYFSARDWSRDGFEGISRAALGIGTDAENLAQSGRDTGMFVSEFFDRISKNPEFTPEHAAAASEPIGDLLKHYMPAVQSAVGHGASGDLLPAQLKPLDDQPYLPFVEFYPELDQGDLLKLMNVALSSEEGVARVAEGIAGYRQTVLQGFTQAFDSLDADGAAQELGRLLGDSASLEGYVQRRVGEAAIAGAVSQDQQVAAFTKLVSEAAGLVPVPFSAEVGEIAGEAGTKLWSAAWGHVQKLPTDHITETFASSAAAAVQTQRGAAEISEREMVINSYLSLVHAGVLDVPAERLEVWAPDGELVSLGTIDPNDLQFYRGQVDLVMQGAVDPKYLELIYESEFQRWFEKA
jgi:hypothetical protein